MLFKDEQIFFSSPLSPNDGWVENIVPSLSALAAQPTWQVFGNDHPVLSAVFFDFGFEDIILSRCPLAANEDMRWDLFINLLYWWQKLWDFGLLILALLNRLNSCNFLIDVLELEPSLEATNLGLVGHEFAKSVPWVFAIDLDKISEFNILYWY